MKKVDNPRSSEKPTAPDELLDCRMEMLGLDLDAIERFENSTLDEIRRRCTSCGYREACEVDLKRDPNNPVWETYCPNSEALIALAQVPWLTQ